jgi:ribosome-binding ATPase
MGFQCGIVGLPNVGKSTLFNALTNSTIAAAANYPFCTIEPNVGRVPVPDSRLEKIAAIAGTKVLIPTFMEFVDIAGLVRGASKGEGLGNQFLANIRTCDAVAHVLRCFDDSDITHVEGGVDPVRDADIIETELMLADLESIEKRLLSVAKKAKTGDKEAVTLLPLLEQAATLLAAGQPVRHGQYLEHHVLMQQQQFLTNKPILYVLNVLEKEAAHPNANPYVQAAKAMADKEGASVVVISAAIEAEVAQLPLEERAAFLKDIGLEEAGLNRLIRAGYTLLNLETYFTAGVKEARAWTIHRGATAPQAAGVIHSDFERGFIAAEIIAYEDYIAYHGETGAKDAGKWRQEGKTYIMHDGDVTHFRFNV